MSAVDQSTVYHAATPWTDVFLGHSLQRTPDRDLTRVSLRSGTWNSPRHLAKADSIVLALAPTGQGETVAVLEKTPLFAARQRDRLRAAPGKLQKAAVRIRCR